MRWEVTISGGGLAVGLRERKGGRDPQPFAVGLRERKGGRGGRLEAAYGTGPGRVLFDSASMQQRCFHAAAPFDCFRSL